MLLLPVPQHILVDRAVVDSYAIAAVTRCRGKLVFAADFVQPPEHERAAFVAQRVEVGAPGHDEDKTRRHLLPLGNRFYLAVDGDTVEIADLVRPLVLQCAKLARLRQRVFDQHIS